LSALHGLVGPDEQLEPYDLALSDLPAAARRGWGERVVGELEGRLGGVGDRTLEIHAGAAYVRAVAPLLE
jgi:hypothetical protein